MVNIRLSWLNCFRLPSPMVFCIAEYFIELLISADIFDAKNQDLICHVQSISMREV